MKFIALLFSILLLAGCGNINDDYNNAKKAEELKYTEPALAANNATFKYYCVTNSTPRAEFIIGLVISGDVTCPEDLKPFNSEFTPILLQLYTLWESLIVFIFVTIISYASLINIKKTSAHGKFDWTKFIYKSVVLFLIYPLPYIGSVFFAIIQMFGFFGIHTANVSINFISDKDPLVKNISVNMPPNTYLSADMTNLLAFYTSSISLNEKRETVINFDEQNDKLLANIIYGTNELDFEMQLNSTAYELSDKHNLGFGKEYQVNKLKPIITAMFKDAEFVARKLYNSQTMVLTTNDVNFNSMSCAETRAFNMDNVSEIVKQKYIIREGACLSEAVNYALNDIGGERKANLCDASVVDTGTAEACVRAAYDKSLYAGGVATEFYQYVKDQEENRSLSIWELPLLFFKGAMPEVTTNSGIFYNSLSISYSTDIEKKDFSNGYKGTAFSIPFSNVSNTTIGFQKKNQAFEKLEGIDGGTFSEVSVSKLVTDMLVGKDGLCGEERYKYCSARAYENTDKYNCQSELKEDAIYANAILQCGVAATTLSFTKGLNKGTRNKAAEASASTSFFSIPNMMFGVKIILPYLGVAAANEVGNAWTTSEITMQQNEAYALLTLSLINNKAVESLVDNLGRSAIVLGIFKGYVIPFSIFLCLVTTVLRIGARTIANSFILPAKLAVSVLDQDFDGHLDVLVWIRDLFISLIKPVFYVLSIPLAEFAYRMTIYDINSFFDFSGNSILTGTISLTLIFIMIANLIFQCALSTLIVSLTFGSSEMLTTAIQNYVVEDEINDSLSAEEAESHTKQANNSAKDLKSKKKE